MNKSNRWPVGITVVYISFLLIVIGIVIFSTYHRVDLVHEDYYEQEIKYQQQIDRINRAAALGNTVEWNYDEKLRSVTLSFPKKFNAQKVEGRILFFRPSDARQDKLISLKLSPDNIQVISTNHLIPGLWKLKIFWKVEDMDFYYEGILII